MVRLGQVEKKFFLKNVRIDVIWRENLEFSKSLKPNSLRLGQVWVRFRFFRWKQLSRSILELEQCSQALIDRTSFTCVYFGQQFFIFSLVKRTISLVQEILVIQLTVGKAAAAVLSTAKVAQVKAGKQVFFFRFLEFSVISFEYREIGERYARHVSSLTNKQPKKI